MIEEKLQNEIQKQYKELKEQVRQQISDLTTKLECHMHSLICERDRQTMQYVEGLLQQKLITANNNHQNLNILSTTNDAKLD